ncbi:hypothetical protein [Paenibacillus tarimensis]|uniref:hypothetical protein n=1 Tax=Paenibacillus tarimensis TaxID=416012 RepID=UPI001F2C14D1|nr:hypothetical protein [Paenibacillus tarimensis]MCF2944781.1 hypothetical protein [Paenibacillus tarimensis]
MAFGLKREELREWKAKVSSGEIAFITHYWLEPRFPGIRTVTKVGCADVDKLKRWCQVNGLDPSYIHYRERYPHFDLIGRRQAEILLQEGLTDQLKRFGML